MSPFKVTLSPIPQVPGDANDPEVYLTMTFKPEGRRPVITRAQILRKDSSADKTRVMRHNMRASLVKFYVTNGGGQA